MRKDRVEREFNKKCNDLYLRKFKEVMAQKLSEIYSGQIDDRAIKALLSFKVEKYAKEKV